jgi:hypothetical protein
VSNFLKMRDLAPKANFCKEIRFFGRDLNAHQPRGRKSSHGGTTFTHQPHEALQVKRLASMEEEQPWRYDLHPSAPREEEQP